MEAWQPIHTAPVYETVLTAYQFGDTWIMETDQIDEAGCWMSDATGANATHWMPLPCPPNNSAE